MNNTRGGGRDRERTLGVMFAQVPLLVNDDFSNLPGYNQAQPTIAPSCKPPHNISDHITCTRCRKPGHYAMLACRYLIIPATSAPSERVLSWASNIFTTKHRCMSKNIAEVIMFTRDYTMILKKHYQKLAGRDCIPSIPTINEIVGEEEPLDVGQ